MDMVLFLSVLSGIAFLLLCILVFKIHAFPALLMASIVVGLLAGMPPELVLEHMKTGMGGTLGFVAIVIGLGALFGAILEKTGGAAQLADKMMSLFGIKNASWAMMVTGFLVAIPVFFDVGFIILLPMAIALQKKTKKSLLLFALPLLAGLAITHSFIPPTPGPVAVADILDANIGWVILLGFLIGVPAAIFSGPLFSKFISKKIEPASIWENHSTASFTRPPSAWLTLGILFLPIVLIVSKTLVHAFPIETALPLWLLHTIDLCGHPFSALLLANLAAWAGLGLGHGMSKSDLLSIANKSLLPAGSIILLTGAGGVFKQILIETGAGNMLANMLHNSAMPLVLFAFLVAALVRLLQGSATVAMITAAGITAPLILPQETSEIQKALLVMAIASGATMASHVNDSGFWLVSQYLHLNEKQTLATWTVMTCIIGLVGILLSTTLWYIV